MAIKEDAQRVVELGRLRTLNAIFNSHDVVSKEGVNTDTVSFVARHVVTNLISDKALVAVVSLGDVIGVL